MNTSKQVLLGVALIALAGCTLQKESATLQPGERAPATQAKVKIDRHDNRRTGNRELSLDVEHLPPPAELGDEFTTYVVWLSPEGTQQVQNVGELDYDPMRRQGDLDILTPYDRFTIWVTAEPAPNPLDRGNVVVASGDLDLRKPQR
ncbi:MAG TPA: hypothetical protein VK034_25420 [Enhygromyxa sp.]|nr:hypothetical protein [Enhygromyxa sp.]